MRIKRFLMKKVILCFIVLTAGISDNAFAGTGAARDGLLFILILSGFLLLLEGLIEGISYINRNGKNLLKRLTGFIRKTVVFHDSSKGSMLEIS